MFRKFLEIIKLYSIINIHSWRTVKFVYGITILGTKKHRYRILIHQEIVPGLLCVFYCMNIEQHFLENWAVRTIGRSISKTLDSFRFIWIFSECFPQNLAHSTRRQVHCCWHLENGRVGVFFDQVSYCNNVFFEI